MGWCGGRVPCGSPRYMPDVNEMIGPQAVQRFRESQAQYEDVAETILEQNTRADEWAAKYHKQVQMHLKGQSQQRLLTRRAYTASILDASGFKVCGPTVPCAAALAASLVESLCQINSEQVGVSCRTHLQHSLRYCLAEIGRAGSASPWQ